MFLWVKFWCQSTKKPEVKEAKVIKIQNLKDYETFKKGKMFIEKGLVVDGL